MKKWVCIVLALLVISCPHYIGDIGDSLYLFMYIVWDILNLRHFGGIILGIIYVYMER